MDAPGSEGPKGTAGAGPAEKKEADTAEMFKHALVMALAPRVRELRFYAHLMAKSATSLAGVGLILFLVFLAAFPSLFAEPGGSDPYWIPKDWSIPSPQPPSWDGFILGSGENGQDIYYGLVWGARISMSFAIQVVALSVVIGTVFGLVSGYKGGAVDETMMRFTDVFLSIPSLILVMAIAAVLGRDLTSTKFALLMVWWSGYTRLVRGQVLSVRENTYVDAARASGSGELKIMFKHVLPNSWAPVVVAATMDMGTVVLVMAGLGYLGLGAPPGYAEWGVMIQAGQAHFVEGAWWMTVFPGLMMLMFVLAFNLMGDGLRDVLDPKMRR